MSPYFREPIPVQTSLNGPPEISKAQNLPPEIAQMRSSPQKMSQLQNSPSQSSQSQKSPPETSQSQTSPFKTSQISSIKTSQNAPPEISLSLNAPSEISQATLDKAYVDWSSVPSPKARTEIRRLRLVMAEAADAKEVQPLRSKREVLKEPLEVLRYLGVPSEKTRKSGLLRPVNTSVGAKLTAVATEELDDLEAEKMDLAPPPPVAGNERSPFNTLVQDVVNAPTQGERTAPSDDADPSTGLQSTEIGALYRSMDHDLRHRERHEKHEMTEKLLRVQEGRLEFVHKPMEILDNPYKFPKIKDPVELRAEWEHQLGELRRVNELEQRKLLHTIANMQNYRRYFITDAFEKPTIIAEGQIMQMWRMVQTGTHMPPDFLAEKVKGQFHKDWHKDASVRKRWESLKMDGEKIAEVFNPVPGLGTDGDSDEERYEQQMTADLVVAGNALALTLGRDAANDFLTEATTERAERITAQLAATLGPSFRPSDADERAEEEHKQKHPAISDSYGDADTKADNSLKEEEADELYRLVRLNCEPLCDEALFDSFGPK